MTWLVLSDSRFENHGFIITEGWDCEMKVPLKLLEESKKAFQKNNFLENNPAWTCKNIDIYSYVILTLHNIIIEFSFWNQHLKSSYIDLSRRFLMPWKAIEL